MSVFLYNAGLSAYAAAIRISALFNPKARLFVNGRKDLLSRIEQAMRADIRKKIWVHCASLGEFEQGRPVIEDLKKQYPDYAIVLTFFSPSGYEVRKQYEGADHVFYLPIDNAGNSRIFVDAVSPVLCIFVKYELWYHYLNTLYERNIPVILISAIFSGRHGFFKWYGGLQRRMLGFCTHIFVQDEQSATLLQRINITNTTVSGDTRFDRVIVAAANAAHIAYADDFCGSSKILIAGSTWPADEVLLTQLLPLLPPHWRLIIAPHEVHETHLYQVEELFQGNIVRASAYQSGDTSRVLLIDSVGVLMQLYRYGTAAYVGGGFGSDGVHNVLEPAVYGNPCFYGPVFHQFIEAEGLVAAGGAAVIDDAASLAIHIAKLEVPANYAAMSAAAQNFVAAHQGASATIMQWIKGIL